MRLIFSICTLLLCLAGGAGAVQPDEILQDPALEARARALSQQLRCVVCQNENIDSSNAPLARDLRLLVRERLVAGDTDKEILDFVVVRYGNFVLLRPPVQWGTILLWAGPFLGVLLGGTLIIVFYLRTNNQSVATPLNEDERQRLHALLEEEGSE